MIDSCSSSSETKLDSETTAAGDNNPSEHMSSLEAWNDKIPTLSADGKELRKKKSVLKAKFFCKDLVGIFNVLATFEVDDGQKSQSQTHRLYPQKKI